MKLWEVKAQALRLMFADSDIQFSETEFENGSIYANNNTRDKMVRMEDSIRRAIDLYYFHVGTKTGLEYCELEKDENDDYLNSIDLSVYGKIGLPTRIDALIFDYYSNKKTLVHKKNNVSYIYDEINNRIVFEDVGYERFGDDMQFCIWYKEKPENLPFGVNEIEFDLEEIKIPNDVQRMIPYFIKAELYEEDEEQTADKSRVLYINFLIQYRKRYSLSQTKVKRAPVFNK